MIFRVISFPSFGEIIHRYEVQPDPCKEYRLTEILPLKSKKETPSFLGIIKYLAKSSLATSKNMQL